MKLKSNPKMFSFALSLSLALSLSTMTSYSKAYAASSGPELLITEVMPMSQTSNDAYEYIELYNNTDDAIDLKNYKLPYQNIDITNSKIIPSKSVLVICTRSNTSLANFNTFYGTNLTEDKYMTLPFANELLSNSGSQSILLAKDDGTVITRANYNNENFEVKKSVTYEYPETGFDMRLLGSDQNPTPGSVTADQTQYTGINVTGLTLDKPLITMEVNQTASINATISPITASNKSIIWTSSDTSIATVSSNGVITAKSLGLVVITAKTVDGGYTAYCQVTVSSKIDNKVPVTSIRINRSVVTMKQGQKKKLTAIIFPNNAAHKSIKWESDNSEVAIVSSDGRVIGLNSGIAIITVTTEDGKYSAKCYIYVEENKGKAKGHSEHWKHE